MHMWSLEYDNAIHDLQDFAFCFCYPSNFKQPITTISKKKQRHALPLSRVCIHMYVNTQRRYEKKGVHEHHERKELVK